MCLPLRRFATQCTPPYNGYSAHTAWWRQSAKLPEPFSHLHACPPWSVTVAINAGLAGGLEQGARLRYRDGEEAAAGPASISTLAADYVSGAAGTVSVVFLGAMSPGDKSEAAGGGGIPPERGREKGKGARRMYIHCAAAFPRLLKTALSGFSSCNNKTENTREKAGIRPCCTLPGGHAVMPLGGILNTARSFPSASRIGPCCCCLCTATGSSAAYPQRSARAVSRSSCATGSGLWNVCGVQFRHAVAHGVKSRAVAVGHSGVAS